MNVALAEALLAGARMAAVERAARGVTAIQGGRIAHGPQLSPSIRECVERARREHPGLRIDAEPRPDGQEAASPRGATRRSARATADYPAGQTQAGAQKEATAAQQTARHCGRGTRGCRAAYGRHPHPRP
eukprot:1615754-Pleurochrysis_carterae.AAC.1